MREEHDLAPDRSFDGGDLDCGNGLLLLIRRHIDPMAPGELLEILSRESSVEEDLPAWCRLTGNALVSFARRGEVRSYLVEKAPAAAAAGAPPRSVAPAGAASPPPTMVAPEEAVVAPPEIAPLSAMAIGSWPRPPWMLRAIHARTEGRMDEAEFRHTAEDAMRLVIAAQRDAGVDVVTDGEQSRDSYASFVGARLENTQLIPLADLSAMVEDPDEFRRELAALDVPAHEVRHPVAFGPIRRTRPLVLDELRFARRATELPVKVALPGPYLLARTMWLDCLLERAYPTREALADDLVTVLREEVADLLRAGAALVQFDEPVLTEVVFTGAKARRSFMCGSAQREGRGAGRAGLRRRALARVASGFPRAPRGPRLPRQLDEGRGGLLAGDYRPLLPYLREAAVGTLFLEFDAAGGEISVLGELDDRHRIGLGVVNPRADRIESVEEISAGPRGADLVGADRLLLNSDCGFATFADNPVASSDIATEKLRRIASAAAILRDEAGI
ncbi:MAG: sulfurtransferase TusA family protein [Planctomycetota bacterium]